jgi:hypothetical protein
MPSGWRRGARMSRYKRGHNVKLIAGLVLGVVLGVPAGAATTPERPYLCIVEQATGFSFDKKTKSWKQTNFAPGEKYILKRVENKTLGDTDKGIAGSPRAEWGVGEFGFYLFGDAFCADDVDDNGYLWCHGSVDNIFNISATQRSLPAYLHWPLCC